MATFIIEGELISFRKHSRELASLAYSEREDAKTRLNSLFDSLNSLEYSAQFVNSEDAERTLLHCCRVVPLCHEMLVTKVCQLVINLTFKQQITPCMQIFNTVIAYVIEALKSAQNWALPQVLRALGALLYQNGSRSDKYNAMLLGDEGLLVAMVHQSTDEDIKRVALQCMENMCMRGLDNSSMSEDYLTICCDSFVHILYESRNEKMSDVGYCRILIAALRGITHTSSVQKNFFKEKLGEILGAVKTYMLYTGEPCSPPSPLFATLVSQQEARSPIKVAPAKSLDDKSRAKKKKKRSTKKDDKKSEEEERPPDLAGEIDVPGSTVDGATSLQPLWRLNSSESDYSDPEGGLASKLRSYLAKTRISALGCLMAIIKSTEKRLIYGYWTHFLPDTSQTACRSSPSHTLFTCILKDTHHKCRLTALATLGSLLDGSKQYLAAADDSEQSRAAFTAFSSTLGSIVKELHRRLLLALISEQTTLTIVQIIKCIDVLVANTTYQKLKPGLLTRVVKQIKPFLSHRDPNVRVACLTCLGSVLSVQAPLIEVTYILDAHQQGQGQGQTPITGDTSFSNDGSVSTSEVHRAELSPSSQSPSCQTPVRSQSGFMTPTSAPPDVNWVVVTCIRNVNVRLLYSDVDRQYEPLPVRLESLQVLTNLVKGYFACVKHNFSLLHEVVLYCLQDKEPPVQLHGAKLLESLGHVISIHPSAIPPPLSARIGTDDGCKFWLKVLSGPLTTVLQKSFTSVVRATGCDCLSTIGADIFALFPLHLRMLCVTLLLGFTMDDDHVTRASSIRTLGVYVMYPCLRDDVSFVADVANSVLVLLTDSSIIVRTKAAWSLGNVSDAMCANRDEGDDLFVEDFSDLLLQKMLQGACIACLDNDKVRIHAVRALGNILRYTPARPLEKSIMTDLISQTVQTLVKSVGSGAMKVRWNACYALGNVLKNNLLPIGKAAWTSAVFSCLCLAVRDCKNFKVRINAALALSHVTSRRQMIEGDQIGSIWTSLIRSLHSLDTVTDFADFKLRDKLPEQVCSTLVHLSKFLQLDDLSYISKAVSVDQLLLSECMQKYWNNTNEEVDKAAHVQQALDHFEELKITCCDDQYMLVTVDNLINIFSYSQSAAETEKLPGFRKVYD